MIAERDDLIDDSPPLAAFTGIVNGVIAGGLLWALILWLAI